MPVEKKGSKGSSPKVYGYFKVDGDKATRTKKNCSRCGKGSLHVRTQRQKHMRKMWTNRI